MINYNYLFIVFLFYLLFRGNSPIPLSDYSQDTSVLLGFEIISHHIGLTVARSLGCKAALQYMI